MIPPNAYRLDGFFMAFVAFTYDLMNGSETWSSMWCSLHISLDVDRHWMDKRSLCSDYSWEDRIRLLLFQISAVLVGFRREQRYFGFLFLSFFTWNSFGSTKKLGLKIFFLLFKGGFVVLLQRISYLVMAFCWRKSCFLDEPTSCLGTFWTVPGSQLGIFQSWSQCLSGYVWFMIPCRFVFAFLFFRSKRLSDSGALEKASIL